MHVMQLVSGGSMNGAMVHCAQVSQELVRRGHRVTLVCRPDSHIREYLENVPLEIVESTQRRWPPDELRRIAKYARENGVEVFHTHMSRSHFFGILLRWLTGIPTVATAHSRNLQLHWAFNDFVIANSEATRRFQRRVNLVRAKRIETVYVPVDLAEHKPLDGAARSRIRESLGAGPQTQLLGLVGNVSSRKGHHVMIEALPAILAECPQVHLAVVGHQFAVYTPEIQKRAKELGVDNRISWVGYRDDIPKVMSALDVCVVPSLEEPFGLTAVEALAVGTPVVASSVGGLPETVSHEENGLLVPKKNSGALAQAIIRLLQDPLLYGRLSQNARLSMDQRYAPGPLWDRIEEILQRFAKRTEKQTPQEAA